MKRNLIDDIKIIEPPIQEITKKKSGWAKACFTGCGCLVFFLILIIVGIKVAMGPGPKEIKELPANFPTDIPVYDKNNVETMIFISGQYKNRGIEIAAFFPKIILSPLLLTLDNNENSAPDSGNWQNRLKDIWKLVSTPVGDHRDTVRIEWHEIEASQNFIINYYKNELTKANFTIELESEGNATKQFSFKRDDGISGSFYTLKSTEDEKTIGTKEVVLTVNLNP
jgi:hypothetical protein